MTDFLHWLGGLAADDLATVLTNRRIALQDGTPDRLAEAAAQLSRPTSVATALVAQPKPAVQVLTALMVLGGHGTVPRIAALLEPGADAAQHVELVRHWLGVLAASGLAWSDLYDVARVAPGVDGVFAVPEELGASSAKLLGDVSRDRLRSTLTAWGLPTDGSKATMVESLADVFGDPVAVRERLGRLGPEQQAALLDDVCEQEGDFDLRRYQERSAVLVGAITAGLQSGILLPGYSASEYTMPAEVRIALRGKGIAFDPHEPRLLTTEASSEMVEREGRAALQQFAEASLTVMDHVRDRPLKWVRNGGIGAREVNRVAKACRVEVPMVRLILDCAYAAGLFEWVDAGFACGQDAKVWRDLDAGARTLTLVQQWPFLGWMPTQTHNTVGKAVAVGDSERECGRCTDARLATMAEWLRIEDGSGVGDAAMAELMVWLRPLDHFTHREYVVEEESYYGYRRRGAGPVTKTYPEPLWLVDVEPSLGTIADEARMLGLVAHGASTPLLRGLFGQGGPEQLVALAEAMLPAASAKASFGSDLTAVVAGSPTGALSTLLDSCADREGRGGAVTWRFSTASVRRALDQGVSADELERRLSAVARDPLPQPLRYLVGDVGRRHGSVRVLKARAVIRCEDVGLLAEVVADRKLRKLGIVQVAPTVAVAAVGDDQALDALRKAGYLPMPGSPDARA